MKKRIAIVLLIAGTAAAARGLWIPVKAQLAQVLLERAWQRTLHGDPQARPWPWADTTPVARLTFERTHESVIVLAGASGRTMAFAPGHMDGTAMPGARGNCVISAHRDTHFAVLRDARAGDVIRLQRADGHTSVYTIDGLAVVNKRETWVAQPTPRPQLTLITCYPFDAVTAGGPDRFVVTARYDRDDAGVSPRRLRIARLRADAFREVAE